MAIKERAGRNGWMLDVGCCFSICEFQAVIKDDRS